MFGCLTLLVLMIQLFTFSSKIGSQRNIVDRKPTILVGIFITDDVPESRIDAFRQSFDIFHRQNSSYSTIEHIFFLGQSQKQNFNISADIFRGDFPENMNEGKTFEWLKFSLKWFRKQRNFYHIHHMVVKMDVDTTVDWKRLDSMLQSFNTSFYFGVPSGFHKCGSHTYCPPELCDLDFKNDCWMYMHGGFYGMALNVVKDVVYACDIPARNPRGYEDLLIGLWIKNCGIHVNIEKTENGEVFCHSSMTDERTIINAEFPFCNK